MDYTNKDRLKDKLDSLFECSPKVLTGKLDKIISLLPLEYSTLIDQAFLCKRVPKEYLLGSILFTVSTSVGLTFYIEQLGYKNYGNCYFTIVGSRGDAKSEAIKIATKPIKKIDDQDYEDYNEQKNYGEEDGVKRKQILVQNASIEAAHKIHFENPNSVGIAIDEVYGLVEKMSNPNSRDGIAWRNFFLEGYTNSYIDVSRKTTESFRIKESYPTLIGGLQHQFLPQLFANGNLESGFIDRQFFTLKLTQNSTLSQAQIKAEVLENYEKAINNILAYKRQSERLDESIKQFEIKVSNRASETLFNYAQTLINRQLEAKPILKEYMSKMQISIQKLCVLIFIMKQSVNSTFKTELTIDVVDLAIELNEFYFLNFQSIVEDNIKTKPLEPTLEQIIRVAKRNKASQKAVAEITGLHKGTVSKKWNKK
ncbi:YfjI family protein [Aestuariibaculum sp. M13]|uniref:YfjI family protein n=1 Tax=Aestuariibaculum sp. M13 TaxID=2967132 RepID=UPI002159EB0B|nr:YfjI family protein [Aestuariibaculum sp. M13]MCR8667414.1 YfjI family protein [Aestuariibaculum sp. M13]